MAGVSDLAKRQKEFKEHWIGIVRGDADINGLQGQLEALTKLAFPCSSTFSGVEAIQVLHRRKKGTSTGEDGVLAEYSTALSNRAEVAPSLLRSRGPGRETGHAADLAVAVVFLIAQVLVPRSPWSIDQPTMLNGVMRLWLCESSGYLALRHRSSHGFRGSFQAAEIHLAKRKEWGLST